MQAVARRTQSSHNRSVTKAGMLSAMVLGAAGFLAPKTAQAQTSTNLADAQVQAVFGVPAWNVEVNGDGPGAPDYTVASAACGAVFDLATSTAACVSSGFGYIDAGSFFRTDLGVDSFGSLPPSGRYVPVVVGYQAPICTPIFSSADTSNRPTIFCHWIQFFNLPSNLVPLQPAKLAKSLGDPGDVSGDCPCKVGEPINTATGNVYETITDYASGGQNKLSFIRYYNSMQTAANRGTYAQALGTNWRSNYDRYLNVVTLNGTTTVYAERTDGQVLAFAPNGSSNFASDSDVNVKLTQSGSTYTLTDSDNTIETYNAINGQKALLTTIQARNGYTQNLTYNGSNQLATVTDSYNRTLQFTYQSNGFINTVTTPGGLVLTYGYNASGSNGATPDRLASVSYNTSPATSQTYNYQAGVIFPFALTSVVDQNGNTASSWTYDTSGRGTSSSQTAVVSGFNTSVNTTSVAYNSDGSVTVTNPLGQQEIHKFSTLQNVPKLSEIDRVASTSVPAAKETFGYDANGYQNSVTDWNGNTTTYVNNSKGFPTSITEASGTSVARTTTITYQANFNLPQTISNSMQSVTVTPDSRGNPLSTAVTDLTTGNTRTTGATYNSTGEPLTTVGPRTDVNQTTTLTYDTAGNLKTATDPLGHVTNYNSYNSDGRLLTSTDPNGLSLTQTWDTVGNLLTRNVGGEKTTFTRDAAENIKVITNPDGSAQTLGLDAANRLTSVTDSLGNKITYGLDNAGNQTAITITDPTNKVTYSHTNTYDSLSRIKTSTGAVSGETTTYFYDNNGNLTSVTDPLSNITKYGVDALNRVSGVTDAAGGQTSLIYNVLNQVRQVTDPRTNVTLQTYNGFGDNVQTSDNIGTTVRSFDAAGQVAFTKDAIGNTATYTRDALERPTQILYQTGTTSTYIYDQGTNGIGHLTLAGGPAGEVYNLSYDQHGRETSRAQKYNGLTYNTGYSYNGNGQLTGLTYPSGLAVTYGYDAAGQVSSLNVNGSPFLSSITHEPFGPASGWTWGAGTSTPYTRGYDVDYRLASYSLGTDTRSLAYDLASGVQTVSDASGMQTIGYDALRRVKTYSAPGGVNNTYGYDANSNLTSLAASAGTTSYSIDPHTDRIASYTPPGAAAVNFGYDANGSTKSVTGIRDYFYDPRERMVQEWNHASNVSVYYITDIFGQRIVHNSTLGGTNTWYNAYNKNGDVLGDYASSGTSPINETIRLPGSGTGDLDLPVGVATNGSSATPATLFRVYAGHLSEPRLVTSGTVQARWTWPMTDPYGNTAANQNPAGLGAFTYNQRFPGQQFDPETGTNYNLNRDYNPVTGRYLQPDPLGLAAGINKFVYVGGNPVNNVDPKGTDVTIYDYYKEVNGLGHIGIGVGNNQSWGYYPLDRSLVSKLRQVADQSQQGTIGLDNPGDSEPYRSLTIPTTPQQDQAIQNYINDRFLNPGNYNLYSRQCSGFVSAALQAGGLQVPNGTLDVVPNILFNDLEQIYTPPQTRLFATFGVPLKLTLE